MEQVRPPEECLFFHTCIIFYNPIALDDYLSHLEGLEKFYKDDDIE